MVDSYSLRIPRTRVMISLCNSPPTTDAPKSTVYMEFYIKLVYNFIRNKLFDIFDRHWSFIGSNHLPQTNLSHTGLEGKKYLCWSLFRMLVYHCFEFGIWEGNCSITKSYLFIYSFRSMSSWSCIVQNTCGY